MLSGRSSNSLMSIPTFLCAVLAFTLGCDGALQRGAAPGTVLPVGVERVGHVQPPGLREASGIAASSRNTNVFWTHTDGDKKPILYAINRQGRGLAQFPVATRMEDWEDIASDGAGHLLLGDIGNNDALRTELRVYEVDEPAITKAQGRLTINKEWRLQFPKKPFDCESLFVFGGDGYVVSKVFNDKGGSLYRFPLAKPGAVVLEKVCQLPVSSPITSATLSSDGKKLAMTSHSGAFLFQINNRIESAARVKPVHLKMRDHHIEGCTFVPEGLLLISEERDLFLVKQSAFIPTR